MTIFSRQVHRFSLMTYDYSNPNKPGPNSPVDWIRTSVEHLSKGLSKDIRAKLLVGLNFYGNDYLQGGGGGAILGHQYAELLAAHKPALTWNAQYEEHVFTYTTNRQKHTVYYPTVTVRASIFFFFFLFFFSPTQAKRPCSPVDTASLRLGQRTGGWYFSLGDWTGT